MTSQKGSTLVGALMVMVLMGLLLPVMVRWNQNNARMSVKQQRSATALSLAEAGIERGLMRAKTAATNMGDLRALINANAPLLDGYRFDRTYRDPGTRGSYRVSIQNGAGPLDIVIIAEGRDPSTQEIRSLRAQYRHQAVPAAVISHNDLRLGGNGVVNWGPIFSRGRINYLPLSNADTAGFNPYPRKIAGLWVEGPAENPAFPRPPKVSKEQLLRDRQTPNNPNPLSVPNEGHDWYSASQKIPDLPILDFAALRQSAVNSNTLNCYARNDWFDVEWKFPPPEANCNPIPAGRRQLACGCTPALVPDDPDIPGEKRELRHADKIFFDDRANSNLVWYWDNPGMNVTMQFLGVRGTVIVRGGLTLDGDDFYGGGGRPQGPAGAVSPVPSSPPSLTVPENAWLEYQAFDTDAPDEYPGDGGLHQVVDPPRYTLRQIGNSFKDPNGYEMDGNVTNGDLGFFGFVYVEQDLVVKSDADVYGALWVGGRYDQVGGNAVFYDENLDIPTLNLVFFRRSWQEATPAAQTWVP